MKVETGWKIAVVCIGLGVIACGVGIVAQRRALAECRVAVRGQEAELETLKSGIQKAMAARPPRGEMRRSSSGESLGFQPPTDENGNPLPPPSGFKPPAGAGGGPLPDGIGTANDDGGGAAQTAPRRPRRRTAATAEQ